MAPLPRLQITTIDNQPLPFPRAFHNTYVQNVEFVEAGRNAQYFWLKRFYPKLTRNRFAALLPQPVPLGLNWTAHDAAALDAAWQTGPARATIHRVTAANASSTAVYMGAGAMLRGDTTLQPNVVWDRPFCEALQDVVACPNWERAPSLLVIALKYLICCKTDDLRKWPRIQNPTTDRFLDLFLAEAASNTTGRTVMEIHKKARKNPEVKDVEFNTWSLFFRVIEEGILSRRGPNSSKKRRRKIPASEPFTSHKVHTADLEDLALMAGSSYGRTWVVPLARTHLTKRARRTYDPPMGAAALRECLEVMQAVLEDDSDIVNDADTEESDRREVPDSEDDGNLDDSDDQAEEGGPDEMAGIDENSQVDSGTALDGEDGGVRNLSQTSSNAEAVVISGHTDNTSSDEFSDWKGCSGNDTSDDMPSGNTPLLTRRPRLVIEIRSAPQINDMHKGASTMPEPLPVSSAAEAETMPCFADSDSDLDGDALADFLQVTPTQKSLGQVKYNGSIGADFGEQDEFEGISDSQFAAIADFIESAATSTPSRAPISAQPAGYMSVEVEEEDTLSLPEIPASLREEAEAMGSAAGSSQMVLAPVFLRHGKRRVSLGNGRIPRKRQRGTVDTIDGMQGDQGAELRVPYSQ
ncbi:hypothetical protein PspLS_11229 [Pyricularia sp. CBS 133598]|nr:hypothetical protein PspLS_11229 [Pyricularia sp. CBS 133598]